MQGVIAPSNDEKSPLQVLPAFTGIDHRLPDSLPASFVFSEHLEEARCSAWLPKKNLA